MKDAVNNISDLVGEHGVELSTSLPFFTRDFFFSPRASAYAVFKVAVSMPYLDAKESKYEGSAVCVCLFQIPWSLNC